MNEIIIFGAGQIAELAHFYFKNSGQAEVKAFVVDDAFYDATTFLGLPVEKTSTFAIKYPATRYRAFVALSYSSMNADRKRAYLKLKAQGYQFASYVSPHCTNFASSIGENCFILEDNTLQPFCKIGNNVVLWSGNHIGHHSSIGDHSFITSHVVISGGVIVGESCFLGVNATVRDHVQIGDNAFVSASALITSNVAQGEIWKAPKSTVSAKKSADVKQP